MHSPVRPSAPEVTVLLDGSRSAGHLAVVEIRAPDGFALPPHVAAREDIVVGVLAGRLEVVVPAGPRRVGAREWIVLPRGIPRRLHAMGDLHAVCVLEPAGLERLADLARDATADPDDVAALLAAAGVTLLPAAWGAALGGVHAAR